MGRRGALDVTDPWQALAEEIGRWTSPPLFWLRDDDATGPTPALATLLDTCAAHDVPVCLAAIPAALDPEFGPWVAQHAANTIVVPHGYAHANQAPGDEKKAEFGDHRPAAEMARELGEGLRRVQMGLGARSRPIFVPPWNRLGSTAAAALAQAGYTALSGKATRVTVTGITVIDVHIDIIDWRGTRGYGGDLPILGRLCDRLAALRSAGKEGEPTGILTHHAVHDPEAWGFLETLFERLGSQVRWLTVDDVISAVR